MLKNKLVIVPQISRKAKNYSNNNLGNNLYNKVSILNLQHLQESYKNYCIAD